MVVLARALDVATRHSILAAALLAWMPTAASYAQSTRVYSYDALGRLTFSAGSTGSTSYRFDAAGNRSRASCCELIGSAIQPDGFDGDYYRFVYADIRNAQVDPYAHWLGNGYTEIRNPNRFFDTAWYRATYGIPTTVNALTDYHTVGWQAGRNPSPEFSTSLYLSAYPDIQAAGVNPLWHYLAYGYSEGRFRFPVP